ncbi:MAG: helix-turn-helix domain-containing protein [Bacteroidia bacterium]
MQHFNLSPSLFADEIGVNRPAISHIISGRNKPGVDLIQKVLKRFPEVSTDWLLMGTGSMLPVNVNPAVTAKTQEQPAAATAHKDLFTYAESEDSKGEENTEPKVKQDILAVNETKDGQIKRITVYFNDGTFKDFQEVN